MSYSTTKLFARDKVVVNQLYRPSHIYLYKHIQYTCIDPHTYTCTEIYTIYLYRPSHIYLYRHKAYTQLGMLKINRLTD